MGWNRTGSLKGPKGDKGDSGAPGKDGAPGAGTPGAAGQRGSTWSSGTGAPTSTDGVLAGDMYLDVATGDVYQAQ